jgi:hypothetical protein
MDELTPWFNGKIKPVHIGVYESGLEVNGEFIADHKPLYWYWNGSYFSCCEESVDSAMRERFGHSMFNGDPWRGLANKPKGMK